jgi:hypothetical protein
MRTNIGILYALKNILWNTNLKCGITSQNIKKRISNLQTSLYYDCEIVYKTETLLNCNYYEYLLKKILKDYKLRKNREFYNITENEIILIYDFFNELNRELNTHDKLLEYIKKTDIKYYKKIIKKKISVI